MKTKKKIMVVIPALNEEVTIGSIVKRVKKYAHEVIVVDDGSIDHTEQIARNNGAIVIRQERNVGYDMAISLGFKLANSKNADIIVTFDADGQHDASDIPKLTTPIVQHEADVVVGIRPNISRFAERLFRMYSKRSIGVVDPLCGMKAYSREVYQKIGYFDCLNSIGTQLMFEAKKGGFRITQVEIELNLRKDEPRFGKQVKANIKIFKAMLKIMWYKRFK
jgi:glycosyltransferase involved in cell wall biosynthesis